MTAGAEAATARPTAPPSVRIRRASGYARPSRSATDLPPLAHARIRLTRSSWSVTNVTAATVRTTPWTT